MQPPKFQILCTEDDSDTRDLIILVLQNEGYEGICTDTAEQAISLAKAQSFDLYLLDNWLPDSSGIELCRELREIDSKTPILFYSGAASDEDKKKAQECGAQGYLTKPADSDELVAEVLRLIGASKLSATNSAGR